MSTLCRRCRHPDRLHRHPFGCIAPDAREPGRSCRCQSYRARMTTPRLALALVLLVSSVAFSTAGWAAVLQGRPSHPATWAVALLLGTLAALLIIERPTRHDR